MISKSATAVLSTVLLFFSAAILQAADVIEEYYLLKSKADPATEKSFTKAAASGDLHARAMDLLIRRRSKSVEAAFELDKKLRTAVEELVDSLAAQPDGKTAFVLSELLMDAVSPCRDRELAFWLCKYSAEQGFIPAKLMLGSYLVQNYSQSKDLLIAKQLLTEAAEKFPGAANWQLYKLYTISKQSDMAAKHLRLAAEHDCTEALIEQSSQQKRLTAELASRSGRGMFLYTVNTYMPQEQKLSGLLTSIDKNCSDGALAMAILYSSQANKEYFMALNAACLADTMQSGDNRPMLLINELDNAHHLAMAMLVMWQNQLKNASDLRQALLKDRLLPYDLFIKPDAPENQQRLTDALLKDTKAFYLSGLVFQLEDYHLTYPEIKALLQKTPPEKTTIPVVTAQLLIASANSDKAWQLELSGKLLGLLAEKWHKFQLPDHRKKLAAVIPGALKTQRDTALDMPETIFALSWNLAVTMRINALLANNRQPDAEKFLQKYHRFQLPPELKKMEYFLVQKFAPELRPKPVKTTGK